MSTRCWIGQKREDGIHSFYCHYDGYPEFPHGVAAVLIKYYNSEELATKLVDLCEPSGTSSLQTSLEDTRRSCYEDDPWPNDVFKTKHDYVHEAPFDIEYIYLWDNGSWKIYKGGCFRQIEKYEKSALDPEYKEQLKHPLHHYIDINGIYHIVDKNKNELLKIALTDEPGHQIILETETEKFAGPVEFLLK